MEVSPRQTTNGTIIHIRHRCEFLDYKAGGSGHAGQEEATAKITNRRHALESRESSIGDVEFEER
jgi:hypothetical protein